MQRQILLVSVAGALLLVASCGSVTGSSDGATSDGGGGNSGGRGGGGLGGHAGSVGSGGGGAGGTGFAGTSGGGTKGTAGASGGAGRGGTTGTAGTGGAAGRAGATGTGGTGGSAGKAGTTGSAGTGGKGGTTGSAGAGGGTGGAGGAGTGGIGGHKCGPDPSCATSCTTGACCGSGCCGPGEWCDTSGAAPMCRCGAAGACTGGNICTSGGPAQVGGSNGSDLCGAICCGATPPGCPVSRRVFKRDIQPVGDEELQRIYEELRQIQLTTYQYKSDPAPAPRRLGFIIDDTKSPFPVNPDGTSVDLYGYMSMAVAAIQVQGREIAALRAEIKRLRARGR